MISTSRLKVVHRQEQKQRKFVCVMNDVEKSRQERYGGLVDKEKHEAEQKCDKSILHTRRNIVRQRVLKKCMKATVEDAERRQANKIYGKYQGETVENISGQVDSYLEQNHPKIRRRQKIDELFHNGYESGALLDDETIQDKVRNYFSRPLVTVQHFENVDDDETPEAQMAKLKAPPQTASKSFYTGHMRQTKVGPVHERYEPIPEVPEREESDAEKLFVNRKASKFLEYDVPDNWSIQSDAMATTLPALTTINRDLRPITLPPIKLGTDGETTKAQQTKPDCITQLIERLHKAKDTRERDMKVRKEKRAKRLQAERARNFGTMGHDMPGSDVTSFGHVRCEWEGYEQKKSEFFTDIEQTKQQMERRLKEEKKRQDYASEGRLYLPPIK